MRPIRHHWCLLVVAALAAAGAAPAHSAAQSRGPQGGGAGRRQAAISPLGAARQIETARGGLQPRSAAAKAATGALPDDVCLACHADRALKKKEPTGRVVSLFVNRDTLAESAHAQLDCTDCHQEVTALPHVKGLAPVDCGRCHYVQPLAKPSPAGVKVRVPGVHQRAVEMGVSNAPICQTCHGAHDIHAPSDPAARVSRGRVTETCGHCHLEEFSQYRSSVHGMAFAKGNKDVPVCTTCHGSHSVESVTAASSRVAAGAIPETCGRCHNSEPLARQYEMPAERLTTHRESYHGLANRFGSLRVANCASCHGAHDIRPSSDPQSSINPQNLARTCGHCHSRATQNFARGRTHVLPVRSESLSLWLVSSGFKWFTIIILAGLMAHIALDLYARRRERGRVQGQRAAGPVASAPPAPGAVEGEADGAVERFSLLFRVQHMLLFVSTITLMITGLPLRFPDWRTSAFLFALTGGVEGSGMIHRAAAALLIVVAVFHMGYIIFTAEGRRQFFYLLPHKKDFQDVGHNVLYFFGWRPARARFDRFTYFEKFDYWAVYWGVVIMIGTGVTLWFQDQAMRALPKLAVDMAKEVHSDEALLATLAIVVWHFYNVHFNPDNFPLSWTWWNGRITLTKMRREHPLEYERMMAARRAQPPAQAASAARSGGDGEQAGAGAAEVRQVAPRADGE
jgi:cytochrome b subunit of formate dehydrogenase